MVIIYILIAAQLTNAVESNQIPIKSLKTFCLRCFVLVFFRNALINWKQQSCTLQNYFYASQLRVESY